MVFVMLTRTPLAYQKQQYNLVDADWWNNRDGQQSLATTSVLLPHWGTCGFCLWSPFIYCCTFGASARQIISCQLRMKKTPPSSRQRRLEKVPAPEEVYKGLGCL